MIIRARVVVPMEGEPINDGAVVVEGSRIADVGRFDDLKQRHAGDVVDLGEQLLLPGLINAHCHLDYTLLRGRISPLRSFAGWIRSINALKATLSEADYVDAITAGLAEARSFGTTTIINLEAFPALLPRIPCPPLRVWWCAEMIDVRQPVNVEAVTANLRDWFHSHPEWLGGFGLAPHAPYTASLPLFSEAARIARKERIPLTTHLAESGEEMQAFREARGPLFDFMKSLNCSIGAGIPETPLSFLMRHQPPDRQWIIAHLNELDDGDFRILERAPRFQIAHCPRSHTFLGHAPFAYRRLEELGFNICVGTDSLASNDSLSLFSELRELLRKNSGLDPEAALGTVTVNAAEALGQEDALGRIRAGFLADLVALPLCPSEDAIFESIVAFEGRVPWMMVNGAVVLEA